MTNIFLKEQLEKPPHSQTKTNESFNFKKYKTYNVTKILDIVESFDKEWHLETIRQDMFDVHKSTFSYFVYDHTTNWVVGDKYKTVCLSKNKKLISLLTPIIKDLEQTHDGRVAKVLFIKLDKNKDVLPHKDSFDYANSVRRHHIPIVTDESVFFVVDNEMISMLAGECYEINNSKIHSASNESFKERINLLIDIFPNKYFEEFD